MEEYRQGFTFHGLTWFFTGSFSEKVIWASAIVIVMSAALYMVSSYIMRYLRFEIRTEIRHAENGTITLPTMILCLRSTLWTVHYCYKNTSSLNGSPCTINVEKRSSLYYKPNGGRWTPSTYIGDDCHVVNGNASLSLSGVNDLLTLRFIANTHQFMYVHFLSFDEYKSRRNIKNINH